jgi:CrcB protein
VTALGFVVAAALGGVVRWRSASALGRIDGTLAVNLVGSFVLGLLVGQSDATTTVVGVAGLGTLTTWSTFIAEVVTEAAVDRRRAAGYFTASLVGGVGAAWLGLQLG